MLIIYSIILIIKTFSYKRVKIYSFNFGAKHIIKGLYNLSFIILPN